MMNPFILLTQLPRMEAIYLRGDAIVAIVPRPTGEPDDSSIVRTSDGKEYAVAEAVTEVAGAVLNLGLP